MPEGGEVEGLCGSSKLQRWAGGSGEGEAEGLCEGAGSDESGSRGNWRVLKAPTPESESVGQKSLMC